MIDPVEYFFQISIPHTFASLAPDWVQMTSLVWSLAIFLGLLILHNYVTNWKKWLFYTVCIEYLFLLLYVTIIGRASSDSHQIELTPLWSYYATGEKAPNVMLEVLLNVVLFIPLGILLGICKRWTYGKALVMSLGLSVAIELLQLLTKRGLCETDDVIHNCLGAFLGFGLCRYVLLINRWLAEND